MFKIFKYIKFHENLRLIGLFVCFVVVVVVCFFWGEGEERGHYPIIGRESCYICKNVS